MRPRMPRENAKSQSCRQAEPTYPPGNEDHGCVEEQKRHKRMDDNGNPEGSRAIGFRAPPEPDNVECPYSREHVVEVQTDARPHAKQLGSPARRLLIGRGMAPMVMELERSNDMTEVDEESEVPSGSSGVSLSRQPCGQSAGVEKERNAGGPQNRPFPKYHRGRIAASSFGPETHHT